MQFLIYFLFVFTLASCESDKSDFAIIDSIFQEPECSFEGGMCVIGADCSGQLTRQSGLCPKQLSNGVECCYGISKKETRCARVGGMCVPQDSFCNERLLFRKATDCKNEKCCILV